MNLSVSLGNWEFLSSDAHLCSASMAFIVEQLQPQDLGNHGNNAMAIQGSRSGGNLPLSFELQEVTTCSYHSPYHRGLDKIIDLNPPSELKLKPN